MASGDDILLEARGVRHTYARHIAAEPVLHGIDLALQRGEFVVLMGPSGCGKTTLLHILGLMMRPSAGTVTLEGTDVATLADAGRTRLRRERIGFVFQRFNLLPILTALGNVELPLRLRGETLNGQAAGALRQVGLGDKLDRKPGRLSIGEQQRVALARAVVTRPRLLLADEPTGNLDSANASAVLDLLQELHRANGLTTLMITHNEHLALRADRLLHMRDGRLVSAAS